MKRRAFLFASAGSIAIGALPQAARSETFPSKPVRWIVPWPPGGGSDNVARTIAAAIGTNLTYPVIVDNRPGAGGIVGAQAAAKAEPDGHTIFLGDLGPLVLNTALYKSLPYNPVRDFNPVSMVARYPLVLVAGKDVKAKNAKEWFQEARQNPGRLNYASVGTGSPFHLAMELLKQQTQTSVERVAYKGSAPAMQDLVGGQVPVMVVATVTAFPLIKAGRLKVLGSLTSARQPQIPDAPTMAEQGIQGAEVYAWQGVVVPAGTPRAIVSRLNDELVRAVNSSDVKQKFIAQGVEGMSTTPEEMADYIRAETSRWHKLIKDRGITLD